MEKDIKKESEKLLAKIKAHTPKLLDYIVKSATRCSLDTYWGVSVDEFLVDSINRYVIIDKLHEIFLSDQLMYNNMVYESLEVARVNAAVYEEVITLYEYIEMMYEVEKEERQPFSKWGYEFSINEDGSVSIRREMGKRITIQVDVANKITLV
jgi:hypothetical protein